MTLSNVTGGIFKISGHMYVRERVHMCGGWGECMLVFKNPGLKVDLGGPWPLLH